MGDLINALMAVATGEKVTPVTCVTQVEVTPKTAWIKAVTPVTPVTHDLDEDLAECRSEADFIESSTRYFLHHFRCKQCIAAGQNPNLARCETGSPLWADLQSIQTTKER